MSSRKLEDMDMRFVQKFFDFERMMQVAGINFVRACTYRSNEEQAALYAQGRTTPGHIVTHAQPGQSKHNYLHNGFPGSQAADYYPLENGKLAGNTTDAENLLWLKMAMIGKSAGLEWGGNWPGAKQDMPHFQIPDAFSAAQPHKEIAA